MGKMFFTMMSAFAELEANLLSERTKKGLESARGIVKWNAFKTIPQQYEILEQHIEDQNKINMPLLSDDQLQEINEKVSSKISKNILTDLDYWIKSV